MAGPKKATPPPIDRPLSKAYLRKFVGWSTAYPPGMSEPTSLRVMHNCSITQDGALRIRPGMRAVFDKPADGEIVGTFEHFYIGQGPDLPAMRALLFAVRETDGSVGFRVAKDTTGAGNYTVVKADTVFTIAAGHDLNFQRPGSTMGEVSYVKYVQIDNKILALSDNDEPFRLFFVGASLTARVVTAITRPEYNSADKLTLFEPHPNWAEGPNAQHNTVPWPEPPDPAGLVSDNETNNIYNFGYFYTFNSTIGESAPSMVSTMKVQRRWTSWQVDTVDDARSPDQIAAVIPEAVWNEAKNQGAVSWNLYFFTWSAQDTVPVEGILLKTINMVGKTYQETGWACHTPLLQGTDGSKPLPSINRLDNFTVPTAAGQGIVAADRLVLVYDRTQAARIKWSSNQQGEYLNFSASKGGGYKTLTSGNLFTPASVKLWQNPQSVDTLVVLCSGLDGEGAAYYMNANSSVTAQNQTTTVMGFEETTATPGTTSPYGCEVLNNALYHPLDNNLMKSTASNYNINHALMADHIQNLWHRVPLESKRKIVSSQMDSALYYLVRSPLAWDADPAANGTQIWICDTALSGAWSCWDVVGTALRKLEIGGLLYMAVASGSTIYVFDQEQDHDDVWTGTAFEQRGIPWEAVTNTQGANRAHDAPAFLQQVNVTFGNFTGECEYGIRGKDVYGREFEVKKHYVAPNRGHDPLDRYDQGDYLLVRRPVVEWEFFWKSAPRPKNRSYGSVNYVQYRYTPVTVNVGAEFGSVETFEYGNNEPQTINGVPYPFADTRKP